MTNHSESTDVSRTFLPKDDTGKLRELTGALYRRLGYVEGCIDNLDFHSPSLTAEREWLRNILDIYERS
jgi:hypothetical protein